MFVHDCSSFIHLFIPKLHQSSFINQIFSFIHCEIMSDSGWSHIFYGNNTIIQYYKAERDYRNVWHEPVSSQMCVSALLVELFVVFYIVFVYDSWFWVSVIHYWIEIISLVPRMLLLLPSWYWWPRRKQHKSFIFSN